MSNRLSTKFCQTFEPNLEEAKRNNLIGKWLEHVQCSFLKVTYKEKVFFLDRGQVEAFASFEKCKNTPLAFTEELKTLTENNINIQSGDHIFMRLVKKDGPLDFILMFEPSGDHILETVDSEKTVCQVPFLLDYTRRWSSRVENFSGAVRDEIPLIFLSFQFFCSTPMLVGTIALLVYIITCKTIAVLYFGAYSADAYNIAGLLAVVVLGSLVVKGSLGAATFEKAAQSYVIKAGNAIASTTALQHISGVKKEQDTAQNLELTEVSSSTQTPFKNDAGLAEESSRPPKAPGKPHFVPTKVVQDTFSRKVAAFGYGLWLDTLSWKKKTRTTSITGRKIKANGLIQCQGFMEVLDVATEYLKLMTTKQSGFNARVYSTWLLRFAYAVVPAYATYSMISSWVNLDSCHRHGHSTLKSQNERCANINFTAAYSLGFVLEWLTIVLGIMNMTVCFSVLVYSTDVANALTKYWLHRYRELRRISKTEEKRESAPAGAGAGSNKPSSADAGEVTGETVQALIERDAYERYLLTHTYFTEASNQWSVYLFFTLGATFALFLQSYVTILYFYAKYKYVSLEYTILCIVNALVFTMVFACMSYANGAVETMLQGFLYAGANDYALLGGRDVWLEFVEKAPIYWYIFGFAIKKSDVVAYVGGGVSAILGGLVTSIVFADTS